MYVIYEFFSLSVTTRNQLLLPSEDGIIYKYGSELVRILRKFCFLDFIATQYTSL